MQYCSNCKHVENEGDICGACHPVMKTKWEQREVDVKEVIHRGREIPIVEAIAPTPSVSHLGQTALSTLCDICNQLSTIEDFIDTPTETRPAMGDLGSPNSLIHNLQLINEVARNISGRMAKLQEKL